MNIAKMARVIVDVKKSFLSLADEATWMDAETKLAVRDKVAAISDVIAFPSWLTNRTALDEYSATVI